LSRIAFGTARLDQNENEGPLTVAAPDGESPIDKRGSVLFLHAV
jgi:hypothetical protein